MPPTLSNVFGQTSKEILLSLSTPNDYEDISAEKINDVLTNITLKKSASRKITPLADKAKTSFGMAFCLDSFSLQLNLLIEQISFIENQVKDVEAEITVLVEKINTPILTIPGVGNVTAAVSLGEIGDINRFDNPSKLVAYAGFDATVSQSGEYECSNNRISKRGSPYLRKALYQVAFIAQNHDPVFKAYYQKKRSEGKHHMVATNAITRKMCHTIYAILKSNTTI